MKSRKFGIGLLIMLAFVVTTGTFAYWANTVNVTQPAVQSETVTIGTGDAVASTVTVNQSVATGTLVPTTITPGTGEVTSAVFTYTVDWTEDASGSFADGTTGTLTADVTNILVGGVADLYTLVNVVVTAGDESQAVVLNDAGTYTVVVTVTLDEPANKTEYQAVAGLPITFDVTFEATVD